MKKGEETTVVEIEEGNDEIPDIDLSGLENTAMPPKQKTLNTITEETKEEPREIDFSNNMIVGTMDKMLSMVLSRITHAEITVDEVSKTEFSQNLLKVVSKYLKTVPVDSPVFALAMSTVSLGFLCVSKMELKK